MAIFNEILEGRFNRGLQKLFAIKGKPPVRQVGGEIMPVHPLYSGRENLFLEGWNRYGQFVSASSVVAQVTAIRFRNPPNSNIVAVIEKLTLFDSVLNQFIFDIGQTIVDLLSGTFTGPRMDARSGATATQFSSAMLLSLATNAPAVPAGLVAFHREDMQAGVQREILTFEDQELTILPGDALNIREQSTPGAEAIVVNFIWRERLLTESERQ